MTIRTTGFYIKSQIKGEAGFCWDTRRVLEAKNMEVYRIRSNKDGVLFRLARIAYGCGVTANMITALGVCFGVLSARNLSLKIMIMLLKL